MVATPGNAGPRWRRRGLAELGGWASPRRHRRRTPPIPAKPPLFDCSRHIPSGRQGCRRSQAQGLRLHPLFQFRSPFTTRFRSLSDLIKAMKSQVPNYQSQMGTLAAAASPPFAMRRRGTSEERRVGGPVRNSAIRVNQGRMNDRQMISPPPPPSQRDFETFLRPNQGKRRRAWLRPPGNAGPRWRRRGLRRSLVGWASPRRHRRRTPSMPREAAEFRLLPPYTFSSGRVVGVPNSDQIKLTRRSGLRQAPGPPAPPANPIQIPFYHVISKFLRPNQDRSDFGGGRSATGRQPGWLHHNPASRLAAAVAVGWAEPIRLNQGDVKNRPITGVGASRERIKVG